jgi:hypothetical protein
MAHLINEVACTEKKGQNKDFLANQLALLSQQWPGEKVDYDMQPFALHSTEGYPSTRNPRLLLHSRQRFPGKLAGKQHRGLAPAHRLQAILTMLGFLSKALIWG